MNQQIKTWLGVAVIVIIALTAGMFICYQQKNLEKTQNTASEIKVTPVLKPTTVLAEINKRFMSPSNKPDIVFDKNITFPTIWIRKDNKLSCLSRDSFSVRSTTLREVSYGENDLIDSTARDNLDSKISTYLQEQGFVKSERNTRLTDKNFGRIGFERGNLKCVIYHELDGGYEVSCVNYTSEDEGDFDALYPVMSKTLGTDGIFCITKKEGLFAAGSAGGLVDELPGPGGGWFAKQENGEWKVIFVQDAPPCSFVEDFPASFGILSCATEDGKLKTLSADTSDWQTYRNEKYGFEFKYPGDWTAQLHEGDSNTVDLYPTGNRPVLEAATPTGNITVVILSNPSKLDLKNFYDGQKQVNLYQDATMGTEEIKIDGREATKFKGVSGLFPSSYITSIVHDNIVIEITDLAAIHQQDGIYNQILSTFKFTD